MDFAIGISIALSVWDQLRDMRKIGPVYSAMAALSITVHPGADQCCNGIRLGYCYTMHVTLCHTPTYAANAAAAIWPTLLQTMSVQPAHPALFNLAQGQTGGAMGCNLYSSAA
jgi:hypothetical protein